jgi:hypothetical protein
MIFSAALIASWGFGFRLSAARRAELRCSSSCVTALKSSASVSGLGAGAEFRLGRSLLLLHLAVREARVFGILEQRVGIGLGRDHDPLRTWRCAVG